MNGPVVTALTPRCAAWAREDVACYIRAVALGIAGPLALVPDNPSKRVYVAGVDATLSAVCAAFGLAYTPERRELTP
jgi:hypothetical protein